MGIEETLRRRKDIPDNEVEELVARAAKLQDEAHAGVSNRASSNDVEAVAAELDIAPEFVEQAIQGWRKETGIGADDTGQSRIAQRRKRTMRIVLATGVVVIGGTAAAAVGGVALFGLTGLLTVSAIGIMGLGFLVWLIS
jgi:hypothetical protein